MIELTQYQEQVFQKGTKLWRILRDKLNSGKRLSPEQTSSSKKDVLTQAIQAGDRELIKKELYANYQRPLSLFSLWKRKPELFQLLLERDMFDSDVRVLEQAFNESKAGLVQALNLEVKGRDILVFAHNFSLNHKLQLLLFEKQIH